MRNGDPDGYPGCVNLSFAYVEGESLLMALKDVALSSGSACTSASLEPSYVLRALGAAEDMAHSSLRFGMGRFTTEAEVDFVVKRIVAVVNRLREMRYAHSFPIAQRELLIADDLPARCGRWCRRASISVQSTGVNRNTESLHSSCILHILNVHTLTT